MQIAWILPQRKRGIVFLQEHLLHHYPFHADGQT
jgi:hypothetical protein